MHITKKHILAFLTATILLPLIFISTAQAFIAQSEPVLKINGKSITLSEFEDQVRVNRYLIEAQLNRITDPATRSNLIYSYKKQILDRMIRDELIIQEGNKNKVKISEGLIEKNGNVMLQSLHDEYMEDYEKIFPITGTTKESFKQLQRSHIMAEAILLRLYIPSELSNEGYMNQEFDRMRKAAKIEIFLTQYSETEQRFLHQVFPQASYFVKQDVDPPHYIAYLEDPKTQKRTALGFCYQTVDTNPGLYAYSSRINILVGIDTKARISAIKVLEEKESGYLAAAVLRSQKFADQFNGKSLKDTFLPGKDIDAVSGATVSIKAAAAGVREGGRLIATKFYQVGKFQEVKQPLISDNQVWRLIGMLVLFMVTAIGVLSKQNRLRYVVLLTSAIVIGFVTKDFLSIAHPATLMSLHLPPLAGSVPWYLVPVLGLILTIWLGRAYCGWLCPFGAIQELLTFIKPLQLRIPLKFEHILDKIKYVVLVLTLYLFLRGNTDILQITEPFATVFSLSGSTLLFVLAAVAILPNFLIYRFYCRYLCPLGAVLAVLSLLSINKVSRREACVSCRACEKICRFEAISGGSISRSECIRCADCERSYIENRCPGQKDLRSANDSPT